MGEGDRLSEVVTRAANLVIAQAGCGKVEAVDRLVDQAAELGQSLEHTALDVLDGVIRFDR
jgi:hypothetical protein